MPRRSGFFLPHAAHFSLSALCRGGARCCNRRFANTATTITSERKNDSSIGGGGEKEGFDQSAGLAFGRGGEEERNLGHKHSESFAVYVCGIRGGGSGDDD